MGHTVEAPDTTDGLPRRERRTFPRVHYARGILPPGVRVKREPKFTHTYVFGHPEFVFEDVEVDAGQVLGGIGQGLELTKD